MGAEEDAALKGKVEARNELESYAYSLKNQLSDKEKLGGKLSEDEQSKIEEVINEKIKWLEDNPEADVDEFKAQKKEMEDIVQPIIAKLYQGAGGPPPGWRRRGRRRIQRRAVETATFSFSLSVPLLVTDKLSGGPTPLFFPTEKAVKC